MPAVALEAVDLAALCAILLLMGLLIAVAYTFEKLSEALNVSIVGYHPFAGIGNAIHNTIVEGCNAGIKALGTVAHDLWMGAKWSWNELVQSIMSIPRWTNEALNYLWHTAAHELIKVYTAPIHKDLSALSARLATAVTEEATDVLHLGTRITDLATSIPGAIAKSVSAMATTLRTEFHDALTTLQADVKKDIANAVGTAESTASTALGKVREAETAAIDAVGKAEDATATQLRDFIKQLDLTNLEQVLASVPLVVAAVNVLEAETGLGRAECRAKIKGICGTDPNQWANLLGSLVLLSFAPSLDDIFRFAASVADEAVTGFRDVVGV